MLLSPRMTNGGRIMLAYRFRPCYNRSKPQQPRSRQSPPRQRLGIRLRIPGLLARCPVDASFNFKTAVTSLLEETLQVSGPEPPRRTHTQHSRLVAPAQQPPSNPVSLLLTKSSQLTPAMTTIDSSEQASSHEWQPRGAMMVRALAPRSRRK